MYESVFYKKSENMVLASAHVCVGSHRNMEDGIVVSQRVCGKGRSQLDPGDNPALHN